MKIRYIPKQDILSIMPLMQIINTKTPKDILEQRVLEMSENPNYKCVGMYDDEKLIGICGLWFMTRHYIGRSAEPDHVIIDPAYRSQGLGSKLFSWIEKSIKKDGYEALELNTYVSNPKSHKFYYNEGYNILGFHFLKIIRDDNEFY